MTRRRALRGPFASGLVFGVAAYLWWGGMPVYFLAMHAGPLEIVAWRVLFSVVFYGAIVAVTRGGGRLRGVLASRRTTFLLGLAGLLVFVNWEVYVFATTSGRVVEAALGYFVNPIVTILLGVVVLKERLRPIQWIAVGVSAVAVAVLTLETRGVPWIALTLAGSFGCYGLVKKIVGPRVDAVSGLAIESAWLVPIAVVQLVLVGATSGLAIGSNGLVPTLVIVSAGVGTGVPLLFFASAARRLPLSVAGFLQYLTPILQFAIGVLVLQEPMPPARLAGFCIVWLALAILIGDSVVRARASAPLVRVTDS